MIWLPSFVILSGFFSVGSGVFDYLAAALARI